MRSRHSPLFAAAALCVIPFSGCGPATEHFDVAPVKGKVLCDGQPVTEGIVQFAPVAADPASLKPGKSGAGEIKTDGTFEISTYDYGDGVVVGKCKVTAGSSDPVHPWKCELAGPLDFEVLPGVNEVVIEVNSDGSGKVTAATGG